MIFGEEWAKTHYLPHLFLLGKDPNYLFRLIPLFGIIIVADLVSHEILKQQMLPAFEMMAKDPVPNIRMNVAKSIIQLPYHV